MLSAPLPFEYLQHIDPGDRLRRSRTRRMAAACAAACRVARASRREMPAFGILGDQTVGVVLA